MKNNAGRVRDKLSDGRLPRISAALAATAPAPGALD
jgi:hypothetical protein